MLAWVVVTVKLVAVPAVWQLTPPEPVKPGSPLHAPEARYVLLSTKYASWAVAALRASAATRALKPRDRYAENCGIAIAARIPMMATTTSSSISVKPLDFFRFILETLCILSPLAGWVWSCLDTCRDPLAVAEPSKQARCHEESARSRGTAGRKRRRFAARTDGAASRLHVRACPPIATKLTPGTISITGSAQGAYRAPTRRRGALGRRRGDRRRAAPRRGRAHRRAHAVTESLADLPRRRPHHIDLEAFSRAHRNMRRLRHILIEPDGKKTHLVGWARVNSRTLGPPQ